MFAIFASSGGLSVPVMLFPNQEDAIEFLKKSFPEDMDNPLPRNTVEYTVTRSNEFMIRIDNERHTGYKNIFNSYYGGCGNPWLIVREVGFNEKISSWSLD